MKILSAEQIRMADQYTIMHEPIASIELMERASKACFNWIIKHHGSNKHFTVFCGLGNNGGDGLAIARMLSKKKKNVSVYIAAYSDNKSPDFIINEKRLLDETDVLPIYINEGAEIPQIANNSLIIDAVFGTGLSKPVKGFIAKITEIINASPSKVISIDVPTGLYADDNSNNNGAIVNANDTLSFEVPKKSFFLPTYGLHTGRWHILSIGLHKGFIDNTESKYFCITKKMVLEVLKKRPKFSHKNTFGHALLISGSYGMAGAAVLASRACLKSGTGLLTTYIPKSNYFVLQSTVPEAIVITDNEENSITTTPDTEKYSAVAVGPGIGTSVKTAKAVANLIKTSNKPLVIDADALNIIANNKEILNYLPPNSILTPHFKEFERLTGKSFVCDEKRLQALALFCKKHKCITVLKGAHSCVATPDGHFYFNNTGNSGMATAGSGDVLTGIILSFISQKYLPLEAAICAVYLHGLAGDLAVLKKESEESLLAGNIIEHLGMAFKKNKNQD